MELGGFLVEQQASPLHGPGEEPGGVASRGSQSWSGQDPALGGASSGPGIGRVSSPVHPPARPRTHIPVHQHVEADAKSLEERAVLAAILHLVVLGKPGGQM